MYVFYPLTGRTVRTNNIQIMWAKNWKRGNFKCLETRLPSTVDFSQIQPTPTPEPCVDGGTETWGYRVQDSISSRLFDVNGLVNFSVDAD